MDSRVGQSLDGLSLHLSSELCLCNSFHENFVPDSKKEQSIHTFVFLLLGLVKIICPSTGECQGQEAGVGGLGSRVGEGIGDFRDSI